MVLKNLFFRLGKLRGFFFVFQLLCGNVKIDFKFFYIFKKYVHFVFTHVSHRCVYKYLHDYKMCDKLFENFWCLRNFKKNLSTNFLNFFSISLCHGPVLYLFIQRRIALIFSVCHISEI